MVALVVDDEDEDELELDILLLFDVLDDVVEDLEELVVCVEEVLPIFVEVEDINDFWDEVLNLLLDETKSAENIAVTDFELILIEVDDIFNVWDEELNLLFDETRVGEDIAVLDFELILVEALVAVWYEELDLVLGEIRAAEDTEVTDELILVEVEDIIDIWDEELSLLLDELGAVEGFTDVDVLKAMKLKLLLDDLVAVEELTDLDLVEVADNTEVEIEDFVNFWEEELDWVLEEIGGDEDMEVTDIEIVAAADNEKDERIQSASCRLNRLKDIILNDKLDLLVVQLLTSSWAVKEKRDTLKCRAVVRAWGKYVYGMRYCRYSISFSCMSEFNKV